MLFSVILQVIFNITGYFQCFTGFSNNFTGYLQYYMLFSVFLQVILNSTGYFHFFTGCSYSFRAFSVLNTKCYFFFILQVFLKITGFFCLFTGFFLFFCKLLSIILQVFFRKTYRFFSTIILIFLQVFFKLQVFLLLQVIFNISTGYVQNYRFFSNSQLFCNITGTFLCFYRFLFQYYTLFSIFL